MPESSFSADTAAIAARAHTYDTFADDDLKGMLRGNLMAERHRGRWQQSPLRSVVEVSVYVG
jgi:hypothetical protein